MDIKSKSSRVIGVILGIILLAALAVGVIEESTPVYNKTMEELRKNEEENRKIEEEEISRIEKEMKQKEEGLKANFYKALYQCNYALSYQLYQGEDNKSASNIFLRKNPKAFAKGNTEQQEDFNAEEDYNVEDPTFNNMIDNWQVLINDFMNQYPSFCYNIIDQDNNSTTYSSIDLTSLIYDASGTKEIDKDLLFYVIIQTDKNGIPSIVDYAGLDKDYIDNKLSVQFTKKVFNANDMLVLEEYPISDWSQYLNYITLPSNMIFIYASKLIDSDYDGYNPNYWVDSTYHFIEAGFGEICFVAILIVILLALLLPFLKPLGIGKGISTKVPVELTILAMIETLFLFKEVADIVWDSKRHGYLFHTSNTLFSEQSQHVITYGMNVLVVMAMLAVWYIGVLSLRQVFSIGILRFLKEKTLLGRCIHWSFAKTKIIVQSLKEFDFTDKGNKRILMLLVVNYVILSLICCVWFVGVIVLIPYTITLFIIIKKYLGEIKRKYMILLEGTSKIADGNLELLIEDNLGVFEPLKVELSRIQQGFLTAVIEETKSERMKTELITNVSHDLKTPLTAIITYIGLLKEETATEEERRSYLDTLDMKAQRLKCLIEDLFEVSKAASNNITLNLAEVDLANLIKQVLLELDDKIKVSEVEVRLNLPVQKVSLTLDSERTYRIFENLLINVTKYAMPHTRAYIDMSLSEEAIVIEIKNVSATELNFSPEEITERFARGDLSRNTEGSGLGLAITKSFVELQGGKFTIVADGDLFKAVIEWKR